LYLSSAVVSCFEGDDAGGAGGGVDLGANASAGAGAGAGAGVDKKFTQEDVNRFLADDKRKHQAALTSLEKGYKDLLDNNKSLSDQERRTLQENLETVQGQLRTKDQQLQIEKKQLEEQLTGKIKEHQSQAAYWEDLYRSSTIDRSLQDAAVLAEAFMPSQIVSLLKPKTRLVAEVDAAGKATGKFNQVVDLDDKDADGNPTISVRTPAEAVKRMKELPDMYGNLFKSGVVSGIGSNTLTGGAAGGGKIDLRNVGKDAKQYREIRDKNPEALGLRRPTRRS
jgi:hypothetical protein